MKLTNREIWILHKLLDFDITRYLMANSCQRIDAEEKADLHIRMSKTLCAFVMSMKTVDAEEIYDAESNSWKHVHDFLSDILTGRLDEAIDFPLTTPLYGSDYNPFHVRFFQTIVDNMDKIEEIVFATYDNKD